MLTFYKCLMALAQDRRGVTAVEYGLIAALIAAVIVTVMATLGPALTGAFTTIAGDF
jgi:pilus assembly protein Flp/PilA